MNNQETLKALQALKQGIADAEQHLMLLGQLALKLELSMVEDGNTNPESALSDSVVEVKEIAKHLPETIDELLVDIGNTQEEVPAVPTLPTGRQVAIGMLEQKHEEKAEANPSTMLRVTPKDSPMKEAQTKGENLNEKLGKTKTKSTPAQQFEGGHLDDLKKAIPLNLKLAFIKHVFAADADAYNKAIEYLNTCGGAEAEKFTEQMQVKDSGQEAFAEFKALVGRRWA